MATSTPRLIMTSPPAHDPLESWHQETIVRTAQLHRAQYPELNLLFAIPNGGYRHKATAAAMQRQGVVKGVPDMCLPVARGGFHGWWGELKRYGGVPSDLSEDQCRWLDSLRAQGYYAQWHKGWSAMWKNLVWYLNLPPTVAHPCESNS